MTEKGRTRPLATVARLGDETRDLIDLLRVALADELGRDRSVADVLRIAVRRLADAELAPAQKGRQSHK